MADQITPEDIQELDALNTVLGFDALNRWGKIPGSIITEAKNAATAASQTAQTAQQTAAAASSSAQAAEETATAASQAASEAKQTAQAAKNGEGKLATLVQGSVDYTLAGNSITVYAGQFLNATLDPQAGNTNPIRANTFRNFVHQYSNTGGQFELILKDLDSFLGSGLYGWLNCLFLNANKVTCGNIAITAIDSSNSVMAFRICVNDRSCTVECLSNCRAGLTGAGIFLPPIPAGASVAVDATLSATSANPVENKAVTAALADKLPKSGGTMTGNLNVPGVAIDGNLEIGKSGTRYYIDATQGTELHIVCEDGKIELEGESGGEHLANSPEPDDDSTQIATTEFVRDAVGGSPVVDGTNTAVAWTRNNQLVLSSGRNGVDITIPDATPDRIGTVPNAVNTLYLLVVPAKATFRVLVTVNGNMKEFAVTGLLKTSMYLMQVRLLNVGGELMWSLITNVSME